MSRSLTHIEATLLAHRYLYYCLGVSAISDFDYDRLESRAKASTLLPDDSAIWECGSDLKEDYPPEVVELAVWLGCAQIREAHQP